MRPGLNRFLNRALFEVSALPYAWLTRGDAWRDHLKSMLPDGVPGEGRLLDVGCGPGGCALESLVRPEARPVGVDRSGPMLRRARRTARARGAERRLALARADALALPFRAGSFEALTAHSLLYLLGDRRAALAEFARVLAPGGWLALLEPSRSPGGLWRVARRAPGFLVTAAAWRAVSRAAGRFEADELAALLEAAGFREVAIAPAFEGLAHLARGRAPGP